MLLHPASSNANEPAPMQSERLSVHVIVFIRPSP